MKWFEDFRNVIRLGRRFVGQGITAYELQRFYECPKSWTFHFNLMIQEESGSVRQSPASKGVVRNDLFRRRKQS